MTHQYVRRCWSRSQRYLMRWLSSEAAANIVSASGAVMFVRVTAVREVDGFDERFFMYGEDIDLCLRMTRSDGISASGRVPSSPTRVGVLARHPSPAVRERTRSVLSIARIARVSVG